FEVLDGEAAEVSAEKVSRAVAALLPPPEAARVAEFLGELCQLSPVGEPSPLLTGARQNPVTMREQLTQAFIDFALADRTRRPLALLVDDLQWGDPLTIKLVDVALRDLADQPFLVVALARPELDALHPQLWIERGRREIRLLGLSKKAAGELVRAALGAK